MSLAAQLFVRSGADFESAVRELRDVIFGDDDRSRDAALHSLGMIAPEGNGGGVARMQGYLTQWRVLGTFINERNAGFEKQFPPEKEIDFDKTYRAGYIWKTGPQGTKPRTREADVRTREIQWVEVSVRSTGGWIIINRYVPAPPIEVIAYAVADFKSAAGGEALLEIEGRDECRIWLNGKQVPESQIVEKEGEPEHSRWKVRHWPDSMNRHYSKRYKVTLKSGDNRVMVKTSNHYLPTPWVWSIRVRFLTKEGEPMEAEQ